MFNRGKTFVLILVAALLYVKPAYTQLSLAETIVSKQKAFEALSTESPFSVSPKAKDKTSTSIDGDQIWLSLNNSFTQKVSKRNQDLLKINLPLSEDLNVDIQLTRADIFTDDFEVKTSSGKKTTSENIKGIHYWGKIEGAKNSLVAISIFDGELSGMIDIGKRTYTLAKVEKSDLHIIYQEKDLPKRPQTSCHSGKLNQKIDTQITTSKSSSNPNNCVRLYLEADNDLYIRFGTTSATMNYVTGVFSQVALLYQNESINIKLSQLLVWDTQDPYTGPETTDYLSQFTNEIGNSYKGDIAHLLGTKGGGGIAYYNVLCKNSARTGYCDINITYNDVPSYSWTVNVLTHEIGHSLGSAHTHDCIWNGNNTQIDDCGNQHVTNPGSCYDPNNPIIPQEGGTIMSYCHLTSVGIDFNLGMGQQPGNLVRYRVHNASCLTACDTCPTEGDLCDDGDACTINDVIDVFCECRGVELPDNDQDGSCENNDPDDNNPCVPLPCDTCTLLTITVSPDNYPAEISWEIIDSQNVVVFAGDGYTSDPATHVRSLCIPDGCYEFIIRDSYGDGICCSHGQGSYQVTDENGITIASGGTYTFFDLTNICFDKVADCVSGEACDDGDHCTINDSMDEECNCIGMYQDTDGDGVCDADDICPDGDDNIDVDNDNIPDACDTCTQVGASCDDGDDCTVNDTYNEECDCIGTYMDSDNDNVCDAYDTCPGGDDNVDVDNDNIPDACDECTLTNTLCDDNNDCTVDDTYDEECNCVGTYLDSDNDDVCDAYDICPGGDDNIDVDNDNIPDACDDCTLADTICDDGDDCTIDDTYNGDCNCVGIFMDSDDDGVCDAEDICPLGDDNLDIDQDGTPDACDNCNIQGTACDDNDPCTAEESYDENCNCIGVIVDSDNDGVCDAEDICRGGNDNFDTDEDGIPNACDDCNNALIGTQCDDGDICTANDLINEHCECVGTFEDIDEDGICNALDICPYGDDAIDDNFNSIPDACDLGCNYVFDSFHNSYISHYGDGATTLTKTFPSVVSNVAFNIFNIESYVEGRNSSRYIDFITITYVDENDVVNHFNTYQGDRLNSARVEIYTNIKSITLHLSDAYDGYAGQQLHIDIGGMNYCVPQVQNAPGHRLERRDIGVLPKINFDVAPNPSSGILYLAIENQVQDPIDIKVLNALGNVVINKKNIKPDTRDKYKMDCSELSEGMYFINVSNGSTSSTKSVLIVN